MATPQVDVHLLRLPIPVYERASLHQQALQREFDVISSAAGTDASFPGLLRDVVQQLDEQFDRFGRPGYAELEDAIAEQRTEVDVTYHVPVDAADAARRLGELLDRADDYCRSGTHLLTLATPEESLSFRRWFLGQFVDQIDGHAPVSWPDWVAQTSMPPGPGADEADDTDALGDETPTSSDEPLAEGWSLERAEGHTRLIVSGELDFDTVSTLRGALQRAREDATSVSLDGRAVTFIDSMAISVLIAARNRLEQIGIGLRIEASPAMFRTLEIAGLVDALGVVEVIGSDPSGDPGDLGHARA